MKMILGCFLVLVFCSGVLSQTKKPTSNPQNISPAEATARLITLLKQRQILEEKIAPLLVRYSEDYPDVKTIRAEIDTINKEVSRLSLAELNIDRIGIFETEVNSNELMKIIIVQNRKIIELLEKLVNKR